MIRRRCKATTSAGRRCRNVVEGGPDLCGYHDGSFAALMAKADEAIEAGRLRVRELHRALVDVGRASGEMAS